MSLVKTKTIHLVANSHIDPVWLWDKYEGIDEVINTFRSACDRLDEYPSLKFSMSSTCFLKWTHHFAPDVFARIQAHVAEGRWEIAGGWWIEPDCNLPTEQSFRESHRLSSAFLAKHFPDVKVEVGFCPDSFGHPASFPRILSEQGLKYYVFCRPNESEKPDLPSNLFYWEFEGHRILCYRLRYHYSQGFEVNDEVNRKALADEDFVSQDLACFFFGVGDHGGGPSKHDINYWLERQQDTSDRQLLFSSCHEFFHEAEQLEDIPVYSGDLHMHAVGCYSVNRALKQAIRSSERALEYTRRVNELIGRDVQLGPLWEKTIFNEFHDIMPGSCSPEAARQALDEMGGVRDQADGLAYEALKTIAGRTPVKQRQGEFRIVNSLDQPVTAPIEIESWLYFRGGSPFLDHQGRDIPIQNITPSVVCANRRWLFIDTLPARSEKAYGFDSDAEVPPGVVDLGPIFSPGSKVAHGTHALEAPGLITLSGNPLLRKPMTLGVISDDSDTWSHGRDRYGEAEGFFETTQSTIDQGPLAATLLVRQAYGKSTADLLFRIYDQLPYADLWLTVRWMEDRSVLKLILEPNALLDTLVAQGAAGAWTKHKQNLEEPLHGWLNAGPLVILQDGMFACDWTSDRLRLTLVRSSLYSYDQGNHIAPNGPLYPTDLGEHHFRLRLMPSMGLSNEAIERRFAEFIEPFRVLRQNG